MFFLIYPLVSWEEYQEIAKLVYITDPKNLDIATRHLHELGFLLHFREENLKSIRFYTFSSINLEISLTFFYIWLFCLPNG